MRHLWSLLAGIVAAPLAWLFLATGQHRSERTVTGWEQAGRFDTADLIGPVIFLLVAGILLGVVGTLRWSPAGAVAAGLLLVIPTVFMFADPFETLDAFSYDQTNRWLGQDLQLWKPLENGTLLVLGALLLVAGLSVQRWRPWPQPPAAAGSATGDQPVAGVAPVPAGGPGAGPPMSDDEILATAASRDQPAERPQEAERPARKPPERAGKPPERPETGGSGTAGPPAPDRPERPEQPPGPGPRTS